MNIFDTLSLDTNMSDDDIVEILLERIIKSPEDLKLVSDRAIELGIVDELSDAGYIQAVQNIAHKINSLSIGMNLAGITMEQDPEKYYEHDGIGDQLKKLDQIINMIVLASGRHWDTVSADIDKWSDYYEEQFYEKMKTL